MHVVNMLDTRRQIKAAYRAISERIHQSPNTRRRKPSSFVVGGGVFFFSCLLSPSPPAAARAAGMMLLLSRAVGGQEKFWRLVASTKNILNQIGLHGGSVPLNQSEFRW